MTDTFDRTYWEDHWQRTGSDPAPPSSTDPVPAHPYLAAETADLPAGTALDAGCGTGTEVRWLAERGWHVTGADISPTALATASRRVEASGTTGTVELLEVDVSRWTPGRLWDLVVTSYAHPDSGQLAFYERIGGWVAPGGTLLVVAHGDGHGHPHGHGHAHGQASGEVHAHPPGSTATLADITALLAAPTWRVDAAYETTRTVRPGSRPVQLHDVVVRAHRTR